MRKIVWTCWLQGRDSAPELVKRCIDSWEQMNPEWEIRCLDAESVSRYIDLDDHIDLSVQTITAASLSDIIRILLLNEYGGVWVDATLYCNQPLDDWLPQVAGEGFFAFYRPDHSLASWFLMAAPGNPLVAKWTARVLQYWRDRRRSEDYFWFHHQFGELCGIDPAAAAIWSRVPKIGAADLHVIQRRGMNSRAEDSAGQIDWSLPVFKLVHRVDDSVYVPGTLLHLLLNRLPQRAPDTNKPPVIEHEARVASLKVSTENLGDHIQIIASDRLLRRIGLTPEVRIDRDDEIATSPALRDLSQPLGIVLNGWFKTNPTEWPPHPRLVPAFIGFHIRLFRSPTLVSQEALDCYRRFGPIGCRDPYTQTLLQSHGVDAFLSHCLSLTFSRRVEDPEQQTEIFVVSRDERILELLRPSLGDYHFLSQYSGSRDFALNMVEAFELLQEYRSRAKLIVTTMLHCALPAIAMGIPVIVIYPPNDGEKHQSDRERFSSIAQLVRVYQQDEVGEIDWNGHTVDVGAIKLSIIDRFVEMAGRWGRFQGHAVGPIAPPHELPARR